MIAVILAAGMASRLRPLTDRCPKCLLEVGQRSLLQRTVDALLDNGLDELVVVTGYRSEMIAGFLQTHYPSLRLHLIHNADFNSTNNIYSLYLARTYVAGKDFLLLDSDILFDPNIITRLLNQKETTLAVNNHELGDEEIKVAVDEKRMIQKISKVCPISEAIGESVGIEKINADYSAALFDELKPMMEEEKQVNVFYEKAFERLIPQGHRFLATDTTDLFSIELDTVEDFERAQELIPSHLF